MSELSGVEKKLLSDLRMNPAWASLLRRIQDSSTVPAFKRGKGSQEQHEDWIYQSGIVAGKEYVLKLMGYDNDRQKAG